MSVEQSKEGFIKNNDWSIKLKLFPLLTVDMVKWRASSYEILIDSNNKLNKNSTRDINRISTKSSPWW